MVPADAPLIKYLGSKRRLVPALRELCRASGARTAVDLFTGTTRVGQAFKQEGVNVTAVDSSRTAHVLAQTYVATDADDDAVAPGILADAVSWLNDLAGEPGYVTETFCVSSRYFQPENGARIDAIRSAIESEFAGSPLWPVLITSLLEAADRVDSTTGLQMAYLKQWATRSFRPLELRVPELLAGPGDAVRGDACELVAGADLGPFDLAYLDPPYNQHRYDANYHVWETVIEGDEPDHYGVACKREDIRDTEGRSPFNSRRTMPDALARVVGMVDAEVVVLSYNDESWLSLRRALRPLPSPGTRRGARLRLGPLRRGADRHPRSEGPQGGDRLTPPQHGVCPGRRGANSGPGHGRGRGRGRSGDCGGGAVGGTSGLTGPSTP